ncbi:MAG: hypothetical protein ABW000_09810 [Actinoplanes sp.]
MNSGRPRGLAALLTLALSAGTVAGAGVFGSPAWADATGSYTLSDTSIWTGQTVTLTETALTDSTPDTATTRTVTWGDGAETVIAAGATKVTHTYSANGTYAVAVKLVDDGTEAAGTFTGSPTVTVAAGSGAYKFNPTWNWTWPGGGHSAKLELSAIPANTKRVWVNWGDGETSLLSRTTTSTTHYYPFGKFTASVTLENASGKLAPASAGTYTLLADTYAPTATLKVPSSPSKASSWKTIQGTAKDTQIGMDSVGVQLWKWNNSSDYYYNFSTAKWVKYTPGSTSIPNAALKWVGVDSAGVWKVGVAGLSKGYSLEVDYVAFDKAGNDSGLKYKVQYLSS